MITFVKNFSRSVMPLAIVFGSSLALAGNAKTERAFFDWPRADKPAPLATSSAWDRGIAAAEVLRFAQFPVVEGAWVLDTTPQISMAQRVAYVAACINQKTSSDAEKVAIWAICAADAKALDRKAFESEVAASSLTAEEKQNVLLHFAWVQRNATERQAAVEALAAATPALAELLALPAKAHAEWATAVQDNKDLYHNALKYIDASRAGNAKAMEGCDAALWPHITSQVKAQAKAPSSHDALDGMARTPMGGMLRLAMQDCYNTDASQVKRMGMFAGERTAALRAIWGNKIKFDAPAKFYALSNERWPAPKPKTLNGIKASRGIVETATTEGDAVKVVFKSEKVKYEECAAHAETGKIEGWDSSGRIIWEKECTKWVWKTATETPAPVSVPVRFAAGIKPGRYMYVVVYSSPGFAMPVAVHEKADAKSALVARNGVEL